MNAISNKVAQPLKLIRPTATLEKSFRAGFAELTVEAERLAWIYLGEDGIPKYLELSFEDYVQALLRREFDPAINSACDTVYWAVFNEEVVGRISIRHSLTESLKKIGGHIGYVVRPSARGQGIAAEMLQQILRTDRAKTIGRLLLTCDENNTASEKVILKAGGVLENTIEVEGTKARKKRFWIHVAAIMPE